MVPISYIAVAVFLAFGILVSRIPLRRHRRLRAIVTERLTNAVVVFVLAWKLTPAMLHPADPFRDPLPLLMAAPGVSGIIIGCVAAAAFAALVLFRRQGLRRAAVLPLLLFVGVVAVGAAGLEVASSTALIGRRAAGPPAPGLVLPTLDGTGVSLEALKGRVVIVNFWATWCPPCRAELPELTSFTAGQGSGGAMLIAVDATSTEASEDTVRAFVKEHGISYPVAFDRTGEVTRAWGVQAWPTTVFVDKDGLLSARRTGAIDAAWLSREARAEAGR
jgi:thiol-disulfide isomerase/thioredoxin